MLYFDTCFLVPLVLAEATSELIAEFLDGLPADELELAVSHWTLVEFASLLAREVRMAGIDAVAAREANSRFKAMVNESFTVLLPSREDFDRARNWLGRFDTGLKAGDALHLAIAANHGADAIYSLDKTLINAGETLGLPASMGIRIPADCD